VCGALEADKHCINVEYGRDYTAVLTADLRTVQAGDRCADCGGELYEKKGNELGHIFKLGSKYTKSMNVTYLDENGTAQIPLMGTYGIGVDRALASIIEEHHDDAGIIWPAQVAPFHVHIIPIKYDGEVQAACNVLENELAAAGIETFLDDRDERAGVKFNDADLIGIPYRITVGDRNLKNSPPLVELKRRGAEDARVIPLAGAAAEIAGLVRSDIAAAFDAAESA
jgi:prolyl-tRNA synthetase